MRYTRLLGKVQRTISSQYESKNHELLTRAGFINQVGAGIFTILPLGKRVLTKIENIIRDELNIIQCQEISMPSLHPKRYWVQSGRWDTVNVLFKTKSRYDAEYALGPTHEEIVTPLVSQYVASYRDLPLALYHISEKYRDEARAKSGILRGRNFGMKDLYSFHETVEDFENFYKTVIGTYLKIFTRSGLSHVKITEASGGDFTKKLSHEFNVLTPAGEVDLIYCDKCSFAQNKEIESKVEIGNQCKMCKKGTMTEGRAIEIGNIFNLGTKFSESFDFTFTGRDGKPQTPLMGCYGIGTSRMLGTIAELFNDTDGLIWPENVAPYSLHLIGLNNDDSNVNKKVEDLYLQLTKVNNLEVLYDDRNLSPGQKFKDADLIGIPHRIIISRKTGDKIEYKKRNDTDFKLITVEELLHITKTK